MLFAAFLVILSDVATTSYLIRRRLQGSYGRNQSPNAMKRVKWCELEPVILFEVSHLQIKTNQQEDLHTQ